MYKVDKIKPWLIRAMAMDISEIETLQYIEDNTDFKISRSYYFKLQKQIKESRFDRLALIAKTGFIDQHLERIDQLELINHELWQQYKNETNPTKKANILMQIAELQTFISPYYSASRRVMEMSIKDSKEEPFSPKNVQNKRKKQDVETEV
jgi:hypothetical protein